MVNQTESIQKSARSTSGQDRLRAIQENIHKLVHDECRAARDYYHRLWKRPTSERTRNGKCLTGLRLEKVIEGRILHFKIDENNADFREGDRVRISHGDPLDAICDGEFYREQLDFIEIILDRPSDWEPREHNSLFTLDHSYIDLERFYLRCVEQLGETSIGRERILPLLAGERDPTCDFEQAEAAFKESNARGFNEAQAEAVAAGTSTDLCELIQGPPGTGKTRVLAEIVRNRIARGERILVSAFTHRAIHNALNQIEAICPGTACKIGRPVFDPDLKVRSYEHFSACPFAESGGGYAVGATPYTTQGRLKGIEFDTVIVDEAGQMTLPLAVMAMLSGKTYIFIGDHKQLLPVTHSRSSTDSGDVSIFKHLHGRGFDERLTVTFRMNESITKWPSEQFYYGELTSHEKIANRKIQFPSLGKRFEEILSPEKPVVLVEMPPGDDRTASNEEAILIRDLIEELIVERQVTATQIGVVVPFRRQARLIRRNLHQRKNLDGLASEVIIDTVERMQGQERDIILVSMTSSDPIFIDQIDGFLLQPNRLNVAMTRAKSKLIVLGSVNLLSGNSMDVEVLEDCGNRQRLKDLRSSASVVKWHNG
jgi:DNA replication ATP-dependent helicase Dna2